MSLSETLNPDPDGCRLTAVESYISHPTQFVLLRQVVEKFLLGVLGKRSFSLNHTSKKWVQLYGAQNTKIIKHFFPGLLQVTGRGEHLHNKLM